MLVEHFTNLGIEKGLQKGLEKGRQEGRQEGARAKALETAAKMREHGIVWEIVTDATGVKPEELEATRR